MLQQNSQLIHNIINLVNYITQIAYLHGAQKKKTVLLPEKWLHPDATSERDVKCENIINDFCASAESDIKHERLVEDEWVEITDDSTEFLHTEN